MASGWIILDKPHGLGSTQAVAAVRRVLRESGRSRLRVGHGGTLDPLATGVLPIAVGEATKLCGRMLEATKEYRFTIGFGAETDTLDLEGATVATSAVRPAAAEIEAVLPRFTGAIRQRPPAYSALKLDGRRAYALARAGEAVELPERAVEVLALSLCEARADQATLAATVSKGTYVRSLARDIARALGSVGHVAMLRRTRAGPFALDRAISLDKLNAIGQGAALQDILLPLEAGLVDIPALTLDPAAARAIRQGRVLTGQEAADGLYWARQGIGPPLALVRLDAGTARVERGFNLETDVAE